MVFVIEVDRRGVLLADGDRAHSCTPSNGIIRVASNEAPADVTFRSGPPEASRSQCRGRSAAQTAWVNGASIDSSVVVLAILAPVRKLKPQNELGNSLLETIDHIAAVSRRAAMSFARADRPSHVSSCDVSGVIAS